MEEVCHPVEQAPRRGCVEGPYLKEEALRLRQREAQLFSVPAELSPPAAPPRYQTSRVTILAILAHESCHDCSPSQRHLEELLICTQSTYITMRNNKTVTVVSY